MFAYHLNTIRLQLEPREYNTSPEGLWFSTNIHATEY